MTMIERTPPTFTRTSILSLVTNEECDMFDTEDSCEQVRFTSAIEALERMLDDSFLPVTDDVAGWLQTQEEFMTIVGYRREVVPPGLAPDWAVTEAASIRDNFGEEYGDDQGDDGLSDEDNKELERRFADVYSWYFSKARVYRCEELRRWTFGKDDILELVQQLRPDWLEPKTPTQERSGDWIK